MARQLTCKLAAGIQYLSGDSMTFGFSPVPMLSIASKPKRVPSSERSIVGLQESVEVFSSPPGAMSDSNVSIKSCKRGSAFLRLRLFHISRWAFRFMFTVGWWLEETRFGVWLALTAA